ncbi:hypothetical protein Pst134EA_032760 [Puccinia striiformis f. sp. tritici]|uniref:uncharacterized protein n=1 Tax=Puccinia striiformis f. sp. tritici TaxID=168172 RepID=UPI00200826EC|nr:uncharacterized protein Pst134EA_032760 [Puccinia striiformis f. sp. tritici]KAH9443530.1 hypothetical protein Pst134EA_032760 [Puccinia striiformis f. sp. tritici]
MTERFDNRKVLPLALGKPIVAKPLNPRPVNSHEKALFQLQPSPYRHVEHESAVHEGPDHLESSTRLMQMFDSFLERSPKRNGAECFGRVAHEKVYEKAQA